MIVAPAAEVLPSGRRPTETERITNAIERALVHRGLLAAREVCVAELGEREGLELYRQVAANELEAWSPGGFSHWRQHP